MTIKAYTAIAQRLDQRVGMFATHAFYNGVTRNAHEDDPRPVKLLLTNPVGAPLLGLHSRFEPGEDGCNKGDGGDESLGHRSYRVAIRRQSKAADHDRNAVAALAASLVVSHRPLAPH